MDSQASCALFDSGKNSGKRSSDCGSFARAPLAAGHCPHFQGGAHDYSRSAEKKSQQSQLNFADTILPAIKGDALEIDELVIRFRFKRRYLYLWVVVSRKTRQVLAWRIGDRSGKTLRKLWFCVPSAYRRKLVYTDFYEAYAKWFSAGQHRPCHKGSGKTSVVEGLNNKWRNRVSGLVRKTVCVQHLDDLKRRLWILLEQHNLLRIKQLQKLCASMH